MPFFGMLGSFIGLLVTLVGNPVLFHFGVLHNWKLGDDTIQTVFKNNVDFYFSFQIGIAVAIALSGIYQVVRGIRRMRREKKMAAAAVAVGGPSTGRGDIRTWVVVCCYFAVTCAYIAASALLLRWHHGTWTPPGNPNGIRNIVMILFFLGFVYTPLISYVTARLEGMVGQVVEVPMVREATLILSGYRGVACWFLPIPIANYGQMTVFYRECQLTGTKFISIWKSQLVLYPRAAMSARILISIGEIFLW